MCRMFQVYVGICAQEAGMNMRRLRHSALKTEKRSLKVHLHQVRIALTKLPKVIWTDRIAGMADFLWRRFKMRHRPVESILQSVVAVEPQWGINDFFAACWAPENPTTFQWAGNLQFNNSSFVSKWQIDRFSHFCRAHRCVQPTQTDRPHYFTRCMR